MTESKTETKTETKKKVITINREHLNPAASSQKRNSSVKKKIGNFPDLSNQAN